jgi:RecA/RadA recombinase
MIIELFGPPGAGKTTFANLLAARLLERGSVAELMLSYRPAEQFRPLDSRAADRERRHIAAAARRLARPVMEIFSMALHPAPVSQVVARAGDLLRILPPGTILSSIRMNQYITRLSHSWSRAFHSSGVVLFDQAYIQAICSLSLLNGAEDNKLIGEALDCAPQADLLIRLDAPRDLLEARLRKRQRRQGTLERWLEPDLKTSLGATGMIERLHGLLRERGRPVARVDYVDEDSLPKAAREIAEHLTAKSGADGNRPAAYWSARPGPSVGFSERRFHHG